MKTPTGFLLSSRPEQAALRSEESGRADPCQRTKVAHSLNLVIFLHAPCFLRIDSLSELQ
jgi:hypothetical protein